MDAPPHLLALFLWIVGAPLIGMIAEYVFLRREVRGRPRVTPENRSPGHAAQRATLRT